MKRIGLLPALIFITFLSFLSCDKKDVIKQDVQGNTMPKDPKLETLSSVKGEFPFVTLTGRVFELEEIGPDYAYGIQYSTDWYFTSKTSKKIRLGREYSEDPFSVTLTDLIPGQEYFYRAFCVNNKKVFNAPLKRFQYTWDLPEVVTLSAELNDTGVVVCKAYIENLGYIAKYYSDSVGGNGILQCGISYSPKNEYDPYATKMVYADVDHLETGDTIICTFSDFQYNTKYYYRVFFRLGGMVTDGNIKTFKYIFVPKENGVENGYDYIEMGLSVRWATLNVGAVNPEDYGDFFAWGETEPKSYYDWSTYKWCDGTSTYMTKYSTGRGSGAGDNKTTLEPEDDVAHVKWGGGWRIPTKAEIDELRRKCDWTPKTVNGVDGFLITSNVSGYKDRSIFLPTAGYRYESNLINTGVQGYYWSSSIGTDEKQGQFDAHCLYFSSNGNRGYICYRDNGFPVRPVCKEDITKGKKE